MALQYLDHFILVYQCIITDKHIFPFREGKFIEDFWALGPFLNISLNPKSTNVVLAMKTQESATNLSCQHFFYLFGLCLIDAWGYCINLHNLCKQC
jgi:hypothetical protein